MKVSLFVQRLKEHWPETLLVLFGMAALAVLIAPRSLWHTQMSVAACRDFCEEYEATVDATTGQRLECLLRRQGVSAVPEFLAEIGKAGEYRTEDVAPKQARTRSRSASGRSRERR